MDFCGAFSFRIKVLKYICFRVFFFFGQIFEHILSTGLILEQDSSKQIKSLKSLDINNKYF